MLGVGGTPYRQINKYITARRGNRSYNAKDVPMGQVTPMFSFPLEAVNLAWSWRLKQVTVNSGPEGGAAGYAFYISDVIGGFSFYGGAITTPVAATVPGAISQSVNGGLITMSVNVSM